MSTRCCWPSCRSDITPESDGLPLCPEHYHEVGISFMSKRTILSPEFGRRRREARAAELEAQQRAQAEALLSRSQVYYVRIGDHVKIGFTVNLRQRLSALRVDPAAVLATEPGGRELETKRHRQFAAERVGRREDFNPSRRLLTHIDQIRQVHGEPVLTGFRKTSVS